MPAGVEMLSRPLRRGVDLEARFSDSRKTLIYSSGPETDIFITMSAGFLGPGIHCLIFSPQVLDVRCRRVLREHVVLDVGEQRAR